MGAYARRYQSMEPATILAESEGNESWKIKDIKGIRISSEEDVEGNQFYNLSFEVATGTRKFVIPTDKDSRDILIAVFGDKVHW